MSWLYALPAVALVIWAGWRFFGLRGGDPVKGRENNKRGAFRDGWTT